MNIEVDYEQLGLNIRKKREEIGLTRKELANMVGCSVSHISNIENNHTMISLEKLVIISNIFYTTPSTLMSRKDD